MMGLDATRVRAVVHKELRDFRRKRSIVVTMCVLPLLFLVEPVITIFLVTPSTSGAALQKSLILPIL
jgi:ABC-2 type transport system permease protein